jgi:hypothetical protein
LQISEESSVVVVVVVVAAGTDTNTTTITTTTTNFTITVGTTVQEQVSLYRSWDISNDHDDDDDYEKSNQLHQWYRQISSSSYSYGSFDYNNPRSQYRWWSKMATVIPTTTSHINVVGLLSTFGDFIIGFCRQHPILTSPTTIRHHHE